MDRLKEMIKRLEDLDESRYYNKEERKQLEQHFGRKIDFAFPGWVCFIKKDGHHEYCGDFSRKDEDVMIAICEQRIEGLRQLAARIDACETDEQVMAICADLMRDYVKSWQDVDPRSLETERAKRIVTGIRSIDIKQGRLGYESGERNYSAIVLDPYHGSVVVRRNPDGSYFYSRRVPLCGECSGNYDAIHLKGRMQSFIDFIAY